MNIRRIWAVTCRHLWQTSGDAPRAIGMFYWPLIELMLMGYMGVWVDSSADKAVAFAVVAAVTGWSLIVRSAIEVAWNLLEELWAHNLVNMFASPLSINEWIASASLYILFSSGALFSFLWITSFFLFGYNILSVGWLLIPLICNYYLTGLCIGLLAASVLIQHGVRMVSYIFMISWLFAPLSGVYYSLEVLPVWIQYIAHALPSYYSIDVLKTIVMTGEIIYWKMASACVLNLIYVPFAIWFFKRMFERSRSEGLARLTG